jgi:hypothetical protein
LNSVFDGLKFDLAPQLEGVSVSSSWSGAAHRDLIYTDLQEG